MVSATRAPNNHTTCVGPMGPTDCLAPWIDRSYHLLLLQLRPRPDRRVPLGPPPAAPLTGAGPGTHNPPAALIFPPHPPPPARAGEHFCSRPLPRRLLP